MKWTIGDEEEVTVWILYYYRSHTKRLPAAKGPLHDVFQVVLRGKHILEIGLMILLASDLWPPETTHLFYSQPICRLSDLWVVSLPIMAGQPLRSPAFPLLTFDLSLLYNNRQRPMINRPFLCVTFGLSTFPVSWMCLLFWDSICRQPVHIAYMSLCIASGSFIHCDSVRRGGHFSSPDIDKRVTWFKNDCEDGMWWNDSVYRTWNCKGLFVCVSWPLNSGQLWFQLSTAEWRYLKLGMSGGRVTKH